MPNYAAQAERRRHLLNSKSKTVRKLANLFYRIACRVIADNITVYSAMATFFLILSMVPFIMILISFLRFLLPDSLGNLWTSLMAILPEGVITFATRFMNELLHANTTSVVSLSVVMALWASSKGIMGLELGMHVIYRNAPRGNYLVRRIRCTLYTLILVFTIMVTIMLLVFGGTLENLLESNVSFLSQMTLLILGVRTLVMVILFIIVFTLGYKYLTGTRASFLERLPGATVSTIGWILFSAIFAFYINHFSTYTYLYGSLGALILLLLWLYFCMIILLAGAEVNMILRDWRRGEWKFWVDPLEESPATAAELHVRDALVQVQSAEKQMKQAETRMKYAADYTRDTAAQIRDMEACIQEAIEQVQAAMTQVQEAVDHVQDAVGYEKSGADIDTRNTSDIDLPKILSAVTDQDESDLPFNGN